MGGKEQCQEDRTVLELWSCSEAVGSVRAGDWVQGVERAQGWWGGE